MDGYNHPGAIAELDLSACSPTTIVDRISAVPGLKTSAGEQCFSYVIAAFLGRSMRSDWYPWSWYGDHIPYLPSFFFVLPIVNFLPRPGLDPRAASPATRYQASATAPTYTSAPSPNVEQLPKKYLYRQTSVSCAFTLPACSSCTTGISNDCFVRPTTAKT